MDLGDVNVKNLEKKEISNKAEQKNDNNKLIPEIKKPFW